MLVGAARNALWAFNARVSLTCPVCHRPQDATPALRPVFIARSQGEVMAHRTHGSIQDRTYPSALYCTGGLPPGFLCQGPSGFMPDHRDSERENKSVPKVLDRQYLEACYNAMDQLCFKPEPHIFIDAQICITVIVFQRPGCKRPDVTLIVGDYGGKGVLIAIHSRQDHRNRDWLHSSGHSNPSFTRYSRNSFSVARRRFDTV